jgi:hypothetical protein
MSDCQFEYVDAPANLAKKRCRRCQRVVKSPHPPKQCHAPCRVIDLTLLKPTLPKRLLPKLRRVTDRDPSLPRKAGNVIKAAGDLARHLAKREPGSLVLGEDQIQQRRTVCQTCDYYSSADETCRHVDCGCRLRIKARLAVWHCPLGKWPGESRRPGDDKLEVIDAPTRRRSLLLFFPHGFGDAVQLTVVLQHLQAFHPDWSVDVATKPGTESLFHGLCRHSITWRLGENWPRADRHDQFVALPWPEPDRTYADSPSTKAEKCLREQFQLVPREDLCRYRIQPTTSHRRRARAYVQSIAGASPANRWPVVAVHYQGNSARARKNIDEQLVRRLIDTIRGAGFLPMILDWDRRSRLLELPGVANPGSRHALWGTMGSGDGGALAALIDRCVLMVGIDSGPAHVAAATATPTLVVWHRHHPVHYFCPADNVTHVVRPDQRKYIRGDADVGETYFRARYHYVTADSHYRRFLPDLLRQRLESL